MPVNTIASFPPFELRGNCSRSAISVGEGINVSGRTIIYILWRSTLIVIRCEKWLTEAAGAITSTSNYCGSHVLSLSRSHYKYAANMQRRWASACYVHVLFTDESNGKLCRLPSIAAIGLHKTETSPTHGELHSLSDIQWTVFFCFFLMPFVTKVIHLLCFFVFGHHEVSYGQSEAKYQFNNKYISFLFSEHKAWNGSDLISASQSFQSRCRDDTWFYTPVGDFPGPPGASGPLLKVVTLSLLGPALTFP